MKFLIIGGSRFVGPYLIDMLLEQGHDVTIFNRGRIQAKYDTRVRFIAGDRNSGFGIKDHFDSVIDTYAYNGLQTQTVIEQLNFDFLVQFSSVAVYKKPSSLPVTEESPIGEWPMWGNYNKGKVECELVLEQSGVKYASIRPVFILGPKNYVNRENFIYSAIKNGRPLIIPGDGEAKIQFVFVKNVAESITLLATNQLEGAFNCAFERSITLNQLVEQMGAIVGKEPIIEYNSSTDKENWVEKEFPFPNEDIYCTNDKLARAGILFTPLLEGLKKDYDNYYKNIIESPYE